MSSAIFTPINQVKLTNVSVVRLRKQGVRFELACYRNKLADYRNQRDTINLDDVLQSRHIFSNVSKGELAKQGDMERCFPGLKPEQVIREILDTGETQVNDKEREAQLSVMTREIASMVSERCLNPSTRTPYPTTVVERAMTEVLHYSVRPDKSAKQQCLDVIKQLQAKKALNIVRARLRLQVVSTDAKSVATHLPVIKGTVPTVEVEDESAGIILAEPGTFRQLQSLCTSLHLSLVTLSIKE